MELANANVGFVGAGNMAEAILRGILRAGLVPAARIAAFDVTPTRCDLFRSLGADIVGNNQALAKRSDILILAVKPQVLDAALAEFSGAVSPGTLVVSICAGVTCARLERLLPASARVVRVMPNTPMLSGHGTSAVSAGTRATPDDVETVKRVFASAGIAHEVAESLMDAVTGLSGSGPAYLFRFTEALEAAGVAAGLPAEIARLFAKNTVVGSAMLMAESSDVPAELRRKVTSPGGTTAAALAQFDADHFNQAVERAVIAARNRSRELAG